MDERIIWHRYRKSPAIQAIADTMTPEEFDTAFTEAVRMVAGHGNGKTLLDNLIAISQEEVSHA